MKNPLVAGAGVLGAILGLSSVFIGIGLFLALFLAVCFGGICALAALMGLKAQEGGQRVEQVMVRKLSPDDYYETIVIEHEEV